MDGAALHLRPLFPGDDLVIVKNLVLSGNEDKFSRGIRRFLDRGVDELIISLIPTGSNPDADLDRTFRLLGQRSF